MGVIGWIAFGLLVGLVTKVLMPGRDPSGFILTVLLGVAGSWVATSARPSAGTSRASRSAS